MLNKEIKHTDISEMRSSADWEKLAQEIEATQQPRVLTREGKEVLEVKPVKARRKGTRKGQPFSIDDPLWDIGGMVHSDGPGDVADNVDKYLAEAYLSNDG